MTIPLLEGTDAHLENGVIVGKKMSKSLGNYVGIQEPALEMVGKLMSITDDLMWRYLDLLSTRKTAEITALREAVLRQELHPMKVKLSLAAELVTRYHGTSAADGVGAGEVATAEWQRIFSQRETPAEIAEVTVAVPAGVAGIGIAQLLREAKLVDSGSLGRQMVQQGAVTLDGAPVTAVDHAVAVGGPYLVKVGKRRFARVTVAHGA
jgi:tyrosyl-tRNA synthetase